jgi:hypothetical protein
MAIVPPHLAPTNADDAFETWLHRGHLTVPGTGRAMFVVKIDNIYRVTQINRLPLDILIEGSGGKGPRQLRFGVIFGRQPPGKDYPLPVLWVNVDGKLTWEVVVGP